MAVNPGFWATLGNNVAQGLGYGVGGLAAGFLGSKYASGRRRSTTSMVRDARMAHDLESEALHRRDTDAWNRAQSRGATVSEFYGGAAGGGSPAPQGTAAVLGSQRQQEQRLEQSMIQDNINNALNRSTQLGVAEVQAEASRDVAKIQAGAATDVAEISAEVQRARNLIEQQKVDLSVNQYRNILLPAAASKLKVDAAQIDVLLNEAANNEPGWIRKKTVMQLGVDNAIQNAILGRYRVDITNEKDLANMPKKEYKALMSALLAAKSGTTSTFEALTQIVKDIGEAGRSLRVPRFEKNNISEPFRTGPDMNIR